MVRVLKSILFVALVTTITSCSRGVLTGYSAKGSLVSPSAIPNTEQSFRYAAILDVTPVFADANNNQFLDAGEDGVVKLIITNSGRGGTKGLLAEPVDVNVPVGVRLQKEQVRRDLKGGPDTVIVNFPIHADVQTKDSLVSFLVRIEDEIGNTAPMVSVQIKTRKKLYPKLQLLSVEIDDDKDGESYGNANNRIEKGETVEITALVQNTGDKTADSVTARLEVYPSLIGVEIFRTGGEGFGNIAPGSTFKIRNTFTVKTSYAGPDSLPVVLEAVCIDSSAMLREALGLTLNSSVRKLSHLVVGGANEFDNTNGGISLGIDVDNNIPITDNFEPAAIALVIANSDYKHPSIPKVEFATRDAAILSEYLTKTFGYAKENVHVLENATKAELESWFGTADEHRGRLWKLVKPQESPVFIYYCGHGFPDVSTGDGYIVPVDADVSSIRITGYPLEVFYQNIRLLSESRAKSLTVIMDACFSGQSAGGALFEGISPVQLTVRNSVVPVPNGAVITSSTSNQVSAWYPDKRHSLLTYFVLKAFQGAADIDGDGLLKLGELQRYIADESNGVPYWALRISGHEQTPTILGNLDDILLRY